MDLKFKRLENNNDLPVPRYMTDGAAGMDICSAQDLTVQAHNWQMIRTGFAVEIPEGYELQVRPRSGLAAKEGLTVLNAPGTIDSDYRGEIMVILSNPGVTARHIRRGDRIAQLVLAKVDKLPIVEVDTIGETARGEGGFGSTGR